MTRDDFIYVAHLFGLSEGLCRKIHDCIIENHPDRTIMAQRVALRLTSHAHVDPSNLSNFYDVFEAERQMDLEHDRLIKEWGRYSAIHKT